MIWCILFQSISFQLYICILMSKQNHAIIYFLYKLCLSAWEMQTPQTFKVYLFLYLHSLGCLNLSQMLNKFLYCCDNGNQAIMAALSWHFFSVSSRSAHLNSDTRTAQLNSTNVYGALCPAFGHCLRHSGTQMALKCPYTRVQWERSAV